MELPRDLLHQVSQCIAQKFGMNVAPESWRHLEQQIYLAVEECGMQQHKDEYVAKLLNDALSAKEMEALVEQLTVGETYFFREMQSLNAMARLIARRRATEENCDTHVLRIWSAGCSTGEEPYSIAMMIDGIAGKVPRRVEILATDINARALRKAQTASYGKWSFRGTPEWVRAAYFHPTGKDTWTLDGRVRGRITFKQRNLLDDEHPLPDSNGAFDFIFCRNVLMYLTANAVEKVVKGFQRALAVGGWLIVGLSEAIPRLAAEFEMVHLGGATIYRKRSCGAEIATENHFEREQEITVFVAGHAQVVSETVDVAIPPNGAQSPFSTYKTLSVKPKRPAYTPLQTAQTIVPLNENLGTEITASLLADAKQLAGRGDLPAALASCEKAILQDNTISAAHFLRAKILEEQGLCEEALHSLRRAVYLKPDFVLAHFSLASLAGKNGKAEESAKHFRNLFNLLEGLAPEQIVPHSEGLSVAGLRSLVVSLRLDMVRQLQSKPLLEQNAGSLALP